MSSLISRIAAGLMRRVVGTITHVATDQQVVALTFDDGPDPTATTALLKILRSHAAKATFFMTGENATSYPEVVAAVEAAGHAIGNHSWDHPSFPLISRMERREQILKCAGVLPRVDTRLFRPPYGHQTAAAQVDAWLTGHQVVTWSVVLPDWEYHDGAWLADIAVRQVRAGSIILMHDGLIDYQDYRLVDRSHTLDAVERILTHLGSQYEFVTVPELLRRGSPVRVNWWMKPNVDFLNQLDRQTGNTRRYAVSMRTDPWFAYNR